MTSVLIIVCFVVDIVASFQVLDERSPCKIVGLSTRNLKASAPESWIESESSVVRGVLRGVLRGVILIAKTRSYS